MSAAAVEDTKAVVVEVPEAVAAALHALDDQVPTLGAAVGEPAVEVVQDLTAPTAEGGGEALELADAAGGEDGEPVIEERFGGGSVGLLVEVADAFFGDPGGVELPGRIGGQGSRDPGSLAVGEPLPGPQEVSAGPVERVARATPMPGHLLLTTTPHLGDGGVGQAHDVKPIGGAPNIRCEVADGGLVAGGRRCDRSPRRPPADTEARRHLRCRAGAPGGADGVTEPGRDPRPGRDLGGGRGERRPTIRRVAPEPTLVPHQHGRPLEAQTVSDLLGPVLLHPARQRPAVGTRRLAAGNLDRHHQHTLAVLDGIDHPVLTETDQHARNVIFQPGPPRLAASQHPDLRGPEPRTRTYPISPPARSNAESRFDGSTTKIVMGTERSEKSARRSSAGDSRSACALSVPDRIKAMAFRALPAT